MDMKLALPAQVVRGLLEGIDGVLRSYTNKLQSGMQNYKALLRPAPPLTRYKEELAAQCSNGVATSKCVLIRMGKLTHMKVAPTLCSTFAKKVPSIVSRGFSSTWPVFCFCN